jgi:DNA-binding PadR family transcriptional regulator
MQKTFRSGLTFLLISINITENDIKKADITKDDISVSMQKMKDAAIISPITETSFYILICLMQPLHGYGILKKIEEMTDGRIIMGAGTLYGALKNLQASGLIIEVQSDSERRRNYCITALGKELVKKEVARYEELMQNARKLMEE